MVDCILRIIVVKGIVNYRRYFGKTVNNHSMRLNDRYWINHRATHSSRKRSLFKMTTYDVMWRRTVADAKSSIIFCWNTQKWYFSSYFVQIAQWSVMCSENLLQPIKLYFGSTSKWMTPNCLEQAIDFRTTYAKVEKTSRKRDGDLPLAVQILHLWALMDTDGSLSWIN